MKKKLIDDVEVDKLCLSMINSEINKETPVNVKMLSETIGRNISSERGGMLLMFELLITLLINWLPIIQHTRTHPIPIMWNDDDVQ